MFYPQVFHGKTAQELSEKQHEQLYKQHNANTNHVFYTFPHYIYPHISTKSARYDKEISQKTSQHEQFTVTTAKKVAYI